MSILLIALGGVIGVLLRYSILNILPYGFYTICLINVVGSFILGFVNVYKLTHNPKSIIYTAITVGILGAFTTFSTFISDIVNIMLKKQYFIAIFYILFSIVISIFAMLFGMSIAKKL